MSAPTPQSGRSRPRLPVDGSLRPRHSLSWPSSACSSRSATSRGQRSSAARHLVPQECRPRIVVPTPAAGTSQGASLPAVSASPDPLATTGRLIFQNVIRDEGYAKVSYVPLDDPGAERTVSDLTCERVYMTADEGLCLVPEQGLVSTYYAITFGDDFVPRDKTELAGAPSRARISSDGRYGAATVFVFGHSYADADFSTQTTIIDIGHRNDHRRAREVQRHERRGRDHLARRQLLGCDLRRRQRHVLCDPPHAGQDVSGQGQRLPARDGGAARERRVPVALPDGTRIVDKKRVDALFPSWRLTVLDLSSMTEHRLPRRAASMTRPNGSTTIAWCTPMARTYRRSRPTVVAPPSLFVTDALSPAVIAPTS